MPLKHGNDELRRKFNKELKSGLLWMLILYIIASSKRPLYGYGIIKEIERRSRGKFILFEGTVYPILNSLEDRNLLKSHWGRGKDGPRRKYYTATEAGSTYLEEILSDWRSVLKMVEDILDEEVGNT
ncbi:MAG: PadR family transcriptional regulator [Thermoplasmatota archaeon]